MIESHVSPRSVYSPRPGFTYIGGTPAPAPSIGILSNNHLSTIPLDDLDTAAVVEECLSLEASLLVMSATKYADVVSEPAVLGDLLQAAIDALLVTPVRR